MSQENVEAIRRAYEAYNRGDLESMVVDIAPEFEYETTGAVPGTRAVYSGPEGWREFAAGCARSSTTPALRSTS
jgi:ketosteroid isomerase-like protein